MSVKTKRSVEPAPADPTPTPLPAVPRLYDFKGHRPYLEAAAVQAGYPVRLLSKLTAPIPIAHMGRVLAGQAEFCRRTRGRPLWDKEIAIVRSALANEEECRWHFRVGATACSLMANEVRRAFEPVQAGETEDGPSFPGTFTTAAAFVEAESRRLGLADVFARRLLRSPDFRRPATRLGELQQRYIRTPKEDGRPVLTSPELARIHAEIANAEAETKILYILAEATEAMLGDAYAFFGFEMPATPPPGMQQSRGCDPFRNEKRAGVNVAGFIA